MQKYDFQIRYIPGKTNIEADALTRDEGKDTNENRKLYIGVNILKEGTGIFSKEEIKKDQNTLDSKLLEKCKKINDDIKLTGEKELYLISENLANKILEQLLIQYKHIIAKKYV